MLLYNLRATSIRNNNGTNMHRAIMIEEITLLNGVKAFYNNAKM
jgi:hypothetical protein